MAQRLTDEEFEALVQGAIDDVPSEFRDRLENVAFVIEEEPPADPRVLGTYRGVPLPGRSVFAGARPPDRITIYRGPIERHFGGDPALLEREVRHVVVHEIAHFFGISDQRLIDIDRY